MSATTTTGEAMNLHVHLNNPKCKDHRDANVTLTTPDEFIGQLENALSLESDSQYVITNGKRDRQRPVAPKDAFIVLHSDAHQGENDRKEKIVEYFKTLSQGNNNEPLFLYRLCQQPILIKEKKAKLTVHWGIIRESSGICRSHDDNERIAKARSQSKRGCISTSKQQQEKKKKMKREQRADNDYNSSSSSKKHINHLGQQYHLPYMGATPYNLMPYPYMIQQHMMNFGAMPGAHNFLMMQQEQAQKMMLKKQQEHYQLQQQQQQMQLQLQVQKEQQRQQMQLQLQVQKEQQQRQQLRQQDQYLKLRAQQQQQQQQLNQQQSMESLQQKFSSEITTEQQLERTTAMKNFEQILDPLDVILGGTQAHHHQKRNTRTIPSDGDMMIADFSNLMQEQPPPYSADDLLGKKQPEFNLISPLDADILQAASNHAALPLDPLDNSIIPLGDDETCMDLLSEFPDMNVLNDTTLPINLTAYLPDKETFDGIPEDITLDLGEDVLATFVGFHKGSLYLFFNIVFKSVTNVALTPEVYLDKLRTLEQRIMTLTQAERNAMFQWANQENVQLSLSTPLQTTCNQPCDMTESSLCINDYSFTSDFLFVTVHIHGLRSTMSELSPVVEEYREAIEAQLETVGINGSGLNNGLEYRVEWRGSHVTPGQPGAHSFFTAQLEICLWHPERSLNLDERRAAEMAVHTKKIIEGSPVFLRPPFVEGLFSTSSFKCYCASKQRNALKAALLHVASTGAYVVRPSAQRNGFTLMVSHDGKVSSIRVLEADGLFGISKGKIIFPSVLACISFYQDHTLQEHFSYIRTKLCFPCGDAELPGVPVRAPPPVNIDDDYTMEDGGPQHVVSHIDTEMADPTKPEAVVDIEMPDVIKLEASSSPRISDSTTATQQKDLEKKEDTEKEIGIVLESGAVGNDYEFDEETVIAIAKAQAETIRSENNNTAGASNLHENIYSKS